jgi:serine phosphatase RsbU (regulator of sigma subunit)
LGIIQNAESIQCTIQLAYGSCLTFYSDGLSEAQNEKGELLGFESARALSQLDAEAIVQAATAFRQKDDITVVMIERERKFRPQSRQTSRHWVCGSPGLGDEPTTGV